MEIKKYIVLFVLTLLYSNPNSDNYDITFYSIKMADVSIINKNIHYNEKDAIELKFITTTTDMTSKIFKVDNKYTTIVDKDNLNILSFEKSTFQPNVTNKIHTVDTNDIVTYQNTNTIIPKNHLNIFSLMYYLSITPFEDIKPEVKLEREGLIYNCQINKKIEYGLYEFELFFELIENNAISVIQYSDIFTWAVFKENARRKIIVDPNNDKIIECTFSIGLSKVKAYIK